YYYSMLTSLAAHYDFDLELPFNKLPKRIQKILLYGSNEEHIHFTYHFEGRRTIEREQTFEGIIPNMERRYHETESDYIRDELSRYLSQKTCPDCQGTRLNTAARHVFIQDHTLA